MAVIALRDIPIIGNLFKDKRSDRIFKSYILNAGQDIRFQEYAIQLCTDLISNSISKAGFNTYKLNKEIEEEMWWRLNYEPNLNTSQTHFIYQVVNQMIRHGEGALVIVTKDNQFIVAEDYEIIRASYKPNLYTNITLRGGYQYKGTYSEENVLHFELNDGQIVQKVNQVYEEYGKLLYSAMKNYRRGNAKKYVLNIEALFEQFQHNFIGEDEDGNPITKEDEILDDLYQNRFKAILNDEDSITPLEQGLTIEKLDQSKGNTKSGTVTTRDITDVFDDIINQTADAFHIPRGLLKGDVADVEAMRNNFVKFAVEPFVDVIETEINRKMYGQKDVSKGTYLRIDTSMLSIGGFEQFANAAEAYYRIGALNTNEVRRKIKEPKINEEWADAYQITKNYQRADNIESLKGGEESAEEGKTDEFSETN